MSSLIEIRPCTTFATCNRRLLPIYNAAESILMGIKSEEHLMQTTERMHTRWGYQLSHGDDTGETIVHYGARHKNAALLRIIFQTCTKAHELLSLGDEDGVIPLHTAVQHNKIVNAYTLISLGSPINMTTSLSGTPLDSAIALSRFSITVLLRLHGGKCVFSHHPLLLAQLDHADAIIAQKKTDLREAIGQYVPTDPLNMIAEYAVHLEELSEKL